MRYIVSSYLGSIRTSLSFRAPPRQRHNWDGYKALCTGQSLGHSGFFFRTRQPAGMRFEGLQTRSVSARPTPTPAPDIRLHRGHSVMPHVTIPAPRTALRPAPPSSVASDESPPESLLPPVDELFPRTDLDPRVKKRLVRAANGTSNALIKDTLMQEERGSVLWRPAQRPRSAPGNIHVLRGAARDVRDAKDATCI